MPQVSKGQSIFADNSQFLNNNTNTGHPFCHNKDLKTHFAIDQIDYSKTVKVSMQQCGEVE